MYDEADRDQRVFAREPDFVGRKQAQTGSSATWIRLWATPMLFDGKPVYVAQVGRPVGGRFASSEARSTVLHADVDEARNFMVQDMMYSGGLEKLGFITGVGEPARRPRRRSRVRSTTPMACARCCSSARVRSALSDVQILDWVHFMERGSDAHE